MTENPNESKRSADLISSVKRLDKKLSEQEKYAKNSDDWNSHEVIKSVHIKRKKIHDILETLAKKNSRNRSIFVSHSAKYTHLVDRIKEVALTDFGFDRVWTGFDPEVQQAKTLRTGIIYAITSSDCFLGVWTEDFNVVEKGSGGYRTPESVPRVWMPIELGIAMSMEKPFRLLFMSGIHPSYLAPVQELPHFQFEQETFETQSRGALDALRTRLDETTVSKDFD